ncbi:TPA: glycosyltransferase, partial [Enterobacter kobei]|nr:glycosyltransferase [Enterobacter kobei]
MKAPVLSIVVPCYNEQDVFSLCLKELSSVLVSMMDKGKIDKTSHIVFVDDGSNDLTWNLIKEESNTN